MESASTRLYQAYSELREFIVCIFAMVFNCDELARQSPWFVVNLNRDNAAWAFKNGEAFRVIASLELLGALVGLMVLMPVDQAPVPEFGASVTLSCGAVSRGNYCLLDKMFTTRFPLGLILMELSHQMRRRGAVLRAQRIPRDQNEETDRLTNHLFQDFYMDLPLCRSSCLKATRTPNMSMSAGGCRRSSGRRVWTRTGLGGGLGVWSGRARD